MSSKIFAWRVGVYKRAWDDIYYYENDREYLEYDRDRTGAFFGFGKKFAETSKYNWYLLFDWHNTKNDNMRPTGEFDRDFPNDGLVHQPFPDRDPMTRDEQLRRIREEQLGEGYY